MVIYLPQQSASEAPLLDELTPREIVAELDKHVVGQQEAKPQAQRDPCTGDQTQFRHGDSSFSHVPLS